MDKITTLSEIKDLAQELRPLNINDNDLRVQLKGQTAVVAALVAWELEREDLAFDFIYLARQGSYVPSIMPFLEEKNLPLLISKDVFEYASLRVSTDEVLRNIAINFIAPSLHSLSTSDKLELITTLTRSSIKATAKEKQFTFDMPAQEVLLTELGVTKIGIADSKLDTLMEYSSEECPVYLLSRNDELVWAMKSQFVSSVEKRFSNIKNEMTSFLKNSIQSPKVRAVAYASLAIGVVLIASDDAAASSHTEDRIDSMIDYLNKVDDVLQQNACGNLDPDVCQVKATVISKTGTTLHAQINVGEYIIDIAPNSDPNKKHMVISSAFKYYSPEITITKTGVKIPGSGVTIEDVTQWKNAISKHLMNIAYTGKAK